jgi:hypothetical protein
LATTLFTTNSSKKGLVPKLFLIGISALISSDMRITGAQPTSKAPGPLRVSKINPRYFADPSGKIVYLTGSHTWSDGMEDRGTIDPPPPFDFDRFINFLVSHNHNWFRMWTAEMANLVTGAHDPFENIIAPPFKWGRAGPGNANDGKPKFDFTKLDQAYFDRMRSRVIQAGKSGFYVSVMLFDGYEWQFETGPTDGNPFAGENNVNSVNCPITCPSDSAAMSAAVWAIEQTYLRKVVDTVNDLDNVMYEVSNEAGAYSTEWQARVIAEIHHYEAGKTKQHPVGMTFQWKGGSDSTLYSSEADWISPAATFPGDKRGVKVIINDTDHSYGWVRLKSDGQAAQQAWVWKNLTTGNNVAFMDPYLVAWGEDKDDVQAATPRRRRNEPIGRTSDPYIGAAVDPYWEVLRNAMGRARTYANKIDLLHATPQAGLSSTGFCLAHAGYQYLVYQAESRAPFTVLLPPGTYSVEWYDPTQGVVAQITSVTASGGNQPFTPPSRIAADAVLWLHR